jgi:hypothetical protein
MDNKAGPCGVQLFFCDPDPENQFHREHGGDAESSEVLCVPPCQFLLFQ